MGVDLGLRRLTANLADGEYFGLSPMLIRLSYSEETRQLELKSISSGSSKLLDYFRSGAAKWPTF
jgi:hypothetical protein